MINIGFLINTMYGGGAERIVLYLINNIDRNYYKPYLILFKKEGHYLKDIAKDVEVIKLNSKGSIFNSIKLSKELYSLVIEHNIKIINSHMTNNNLSLLRANIFFPKNNVSLIITEHSNFSKKINFNLIKKYFYILQVKILYKNIKIICVSNGIKDDLMHTLSLSPLNINVIYNPIELSKILKLSGNKPNWITNKENKLDIVAVGRLEYVKGFDILIKAFKEVNQKLPNSRLFLIGDGNDKDKLSTISKELGITNSIIFTGFIENPWSEIKAADLFVLSSRWEGFGNVIIEAMACGTAVLSTNCNYGPNEIIKDDVNGKLVVSEDISMLAKSMIYLLQNPSKRDTYINNALTSISNFDLSIFLKSYSQIFSTSFKNN